MIKRNKNDLQPPLTRLVSLSRAVKLGSASSGAGVLLLLDEVAGTVVVLASAGKVPCEREE